MAKQSCPKCDQILSSVSFSEKRCEHCDRVLPEYILNAHQKDTPANAKKRLLKENARFDRAERLSVRALGFLLLIVALLGIGVLMIGFGNEFVRHGQTNWVLKGFYFLMVMLFLAALRMVVKGKMNDEE